MEYQHIVFEDFARKVQPGINPFEAFAFTETDINPAVKAEFAHAVYRFGHSMLTETISRRNEGKPGADGVYGTKDDKKGTENNISLLDGFLNPPAYFDGGPDGPLTAKEAAGSIVMGMSDQDFLNFPVATASRTVATTASVCPIALRFKIPWPFGKRNANSIKRKQTDCT